MMSPAKKQNPKLYNVCLIETTRLSASLKHLHSSLAQSPGELWLCKEMQEKWFM